MEGFYVVARVTTSEESTGNEPQRAVWALTALGTFERLLSITINPSPDRTFYAN